MTNRFLKTTVDGFPEVRAGALPEIREATGTSSVDRSRRKNSALEMTDYEVITVSGYGCIGSVQFKSGYP